MTSNRFKHLFFPANLRKKFFIFVTVLKYGNFYGIILLALGCVKTKIVKQSHCATSVTKIRRK